MDSIFEITSEVGLLKFWDSKHAHCVDSFQQSNPLENRAISIGGQVLSQFASWYVDPDPLVSLPLGTDSTSCEIQSSTQKAMNLTEMVFEKIDKWGLNLIIYHREHCVHYTSVYPSNCPPHAWVLQEGKYKEAAQAFSIFSYYTPHDITVKKSLSFYKSMPQLTEDDLVPNVTLKYVSGC